MSRYMSFCSRCSKPSGNGKDLCDKCHQIIKNRKKTITLRKNGRSK